MPKMFVEPTRDTTLDTNTSQGYFEASAGRRVNSERMSLDLICEDRMHPRWRIAEARAFQIINSHRAEYSFLVPPGTAIDSSDNGRM